MESQSVLGGPSVTYEWFHAEMPRRACVMMKLNKILIFLQGLQSFNSLICSHYLPGAPTSSLDSSTPQRQLSQSVCLIHPAPHCMFGFYSTPLHLLLYSNHPYTHPITLTISFYRTVNNKPSVSRMNHSISISINNNLSILSRVH